jgi:hypothetical protein
MIAMLIILFAVCTFSAESEELFIESTADGVAKMNVAIIAFEPLSAEAKSRLGDTP